MTDQSTTNDLEHGGIFHAVGSPCPSGRPYPHRSDTQCRPAVGDLCRCTWLGIGTPEHPRSSLCLTPAQDQANRQRAAQAYPEYEDKDDEGRFIRYVVPSSVPRVARGETPAPRTIADARKARTVLGPLRQLVPDTGAWPPGPVQQPGPYETEQDTRLEPMPVAVRELHDAGLVRSGDPEGVVRNVRLAHLVAACEAAGIQRGAFDDRILEWMAGSENSAVQVVIGLIRRAHTAGATAATIDQLATTPANL